MSSPNTPSAFKRVFVGPGAEYAQTGVEEDVARFAGENGDILTITSDPDDGDSITVRGSFRERADGKYNVKAFGAVGDGVVDDTAAIQAAINAANAATYGGEVFFPAGVYRIISPGLTPKSNVALRGVGGNLSVIWKDDSSGDYDAVLSNESTYPDFTTMTNFRMSNLCFRGRADVNRTVVSGQLVVLSADDLVIENCRFEYSRHMGLCVSRCRRAVIRGCTIYRSVADGIAAWNCSDITIADCQFYGSNDDAISCHSDDNLPTPVRSGVMIVNNQITESQGIAVLGGKAVIIANNILRRIMGNAIRVYSSTAYTPQGQTSQFACKVTGNVINDVFLRSEPSPRTTGHFGILIAGGARLNGGGSSPPGEPVSGSGTVASLYGASGGVGTLYLNDTSGLTLPQAAGYAIDVTDNVIMRTLPAVTNVSEWGYGSSGQWVGSNGDGTGFYNGAITDAALRPVGISIDPALGDCRISNNTIRTGGSSGIEFRSAVTVASGDFRGVLISGNKIADVGSYGILLPTTSTQHRIIIRDNEFDGDPLFRHANRGANGTWLAATAPFGIYAQNSGGLIIEGNHFRNVAVGVQYPSGGTTFTTTFRNYQYGTVAGLNFNTGNKGCGTMAPNGMFGWVTIPEDADPTSATYGQLLGEVESARSSIPSTGYYTRGAVVWNTNPTVGAGKVLIGWFRMTTGSAHVSGTDWTPVYGTNT